MGIDMGDDPAAFFSKHLDMPARLLFISGTGRREIPGVAFIPKQLTSLSIHTGENMQPQRIRFADAAPFLVTSSASEEEARSRLPPACWEEDVIIRFRPNINIDAGPDSRAFEEDGWRELAVFEGSAEGGRGGHKATIRCIFKTPRCLSLNVDLKTGKMAPRDQQLYGLLARDRRVNSAFPRTHCPSFFFGGGGRGHRHRYGH